MNDLRRRLRPRTDAHWIVLVLVMAVALGAVAHVALGFALTGIQSTVTSVAIVAGGAFALFKLQAFRTFEPHLTITQEVSHRPVGDSYVHIVVTATLHNSSRVRVDLREGVFRLQQIQPIPDEQVELLDEQVFVSQDFGEFQWPTLDEFTREWAENETSVEPGESHQETCEFIAPLGVESVLVYTFIHNLKAAEDPTAPAGWNATTVRDIVRGS